jgi:micrococcal nuclease
VSLPATGQGNRVTATVRTAPRAACSIEVEYAAGPSEAAGLDPKAASSSGTVSWTWLVGTRTTPGDWPVTVTCSKGSDSQTDERLLTVLDTGKSG